MSTLIHTPPADHWLLVPACAVFSFCAGIASAQAPQSLAIALDSTPNPAAPGATIVYTLRVSNLSSTTPSGNINLQATLPEFVEASIYAATGGSCSGPAQCRRNVPIKWSLPPLGPGATTIKQFTAVIDNSDVNPAPADDTLLSAEATASTMTASVAGENSVRVAKQPTPEVAIDAERDFVAPGSAITYTLTASSSVVSADPIVLSAPLPVGTTFVAASDGGSVAGGAVEWTLGGIAASSVYRRTFTVQLTADAAPGALVPASGVLLGGSDRHEVARASTTGVVASNPLVTLTLNATPDPVSPGQTVVYELNVANLSTNTASDAAGLQVALPPFITAFRDSSGGGSCQGLSQCRRAQLLEWPLAPIAPGASRVFRLTATVDNSTTNPPPGAGSLLAAEATLVAPGASHTRHSIVTGESIHQGLALNATRDLVEPGGELTYELTFNNALGSDGPLNLSVVPPRGTSFRSATGGGELRGGRVEWDLGALPHNSSDRRELTLAVDAGAQSGALILAEAELRDEGQERWPTPRRLTWRRRIRWCSSR